MEQTDNIIALLNLVPNPGFCVRDGKIIHVNQAAETLPVSAGTAITDLLVTGVQEYGSFRKGTLNLTLRLNGQHRNATMIRMETLDLFLLEQESEHSQLQALALASQYLRGPLSGLMSSLERLLPTSAEDSPAVKEQKAKLNRSIYQLLRIIYNMSDAFLYSRKPMPRMEIRDIPRLFDELFEKNCALVAHAGITLHFSGMSESVFGLVDSEKMERAVENLLANAIKHTPAGGTVYARLSRKENMLYFTIEDNGDGISEAAKTVLFNRFLRQPGLGDSRDGVGLGITLVRSIAALHGGILLAQQTKEHGTRFTMTIAIRRNADTMVQSPGLHIDYTGGRDHTLLELSETLPAKLYE